MRLMLLAAVITLSVCLAYAKYLEPDRTRGTSFDGPAEFVAMFHDSDGDADSRWILVCRVGGDRIAFNADDAWVRQAADGLKPGETVRLLYDLPAVSTACGSELGPPTLTGIGKAMALVDADPGTLFAAR
jgi:hypothetical protein